MAKMTIAEAFDFPFRRIGQKKDGEPYYAVGTLRMEPLPSEAIEYEVAVPEMTFIGPVRSSFAEAVGAGIREYAQENNIVGLRATLTTIEANEVGSSDYWFQAAGYSALEDTIKAHGVFVSPITIAEAFDLPFHLAKHDTSVGDWAQGMLRLEPVPTAAVEFVVSLPSELPPEVRPSFVEAVGRGVERSAKENGLAGLRVTLTEIQAHWVDSRDLSYEIAVLVAIRAAIKVHGVPVVAEEKAQDRPKPQDSSAVPSTPKRTGHTKETLKFVFFALVCFLIFGSLTAHEWQTRLQAGYFYPKSSFFFAAFAFGSAMIFIAGVVFPARMSARFVSRSPEELQAHAKATKWKLGVFIAVCLLAGLLNLILISR